MTFTKIYKIKTSKYYHNKSSFKTPNNNKTKQSHKSTTTTVQPEFTLLFLCHPFNCTEKLYKYDRCNKRHLNIHLFTIHFQDNQTHLSFNSTATKYPLPGIALRSLRPGYDNDTF